MSNLYSRYVPPKKKQKVDSVPPPSILAADKSAFSPQESVTPTRSDASANYKRYVPPSKSKIFSSSVAQAVAGNGVPPSDLISHSAVKAGKTSVLPDGPEVTQNEAADLDVPIAKEKTPKKKKKTEHKRDEEEGNAEKEPIEEDPRHASILARREKSLKKAEKLARKAAKKDDEKDEADADEDVEIEEAPELRPLEPFPQPEPVPESTGKPTFSSLPPWLAHPIKTNPSATTPFSDLGVPARAIDVLRQKGFTEAFAVQAAVLPLLVPGKSQHAGDLLVSAATGSGKTLAYVLPMTEYISKIPYTRLSGLIVMPTRELVSQAKEVCDICAAASSHNGRTVKIGLAMGSQDLKKERASLMNQERCYKNPEIRRDVKMEDSLDESDSEDFDAEEEEETSLPDSMLASWPKIDILICTPGRLVEHLKSTPGFTLEYLKWLVIDEADKLLDQSFQEWIQTVMAYLPTPSRTSSIRKVVLSATMTKDVSQLNALKLKSPKLVVLEGKKNDDGDVEMLDEDGKTFTMPVTLHETAIKVEEEADKPLYLLELLRSHKMMDTESQDIDDSASDNSSSSEDDDTSEEDTSSDESESDIPPPTSKPKSLAPRPHLTKPHGVLIFTNSNENALRLSRLLTLLDPTLTKTLSTLSSTIPTSTRNKTLSSFHSGKISILIATDLVSRGLDLPNLKHVVNYDLPTSLRSYVHRVGRTARAGKEGWAWTLYTNSEGRWFWNDIGRSTLVERDGKKVERGRINGEFGDELKEKYEKSLEILGQEARGQK